MSNGCGGTCHCSPSEKCESASCVPLCDAVAQTGCPQGKACVRDESGALRCESPGTAGLGANCDPNGFYVECAAGFACTYENAQGGYLNPGVCREYCNTDADCSNGAHCAYNGTGKNPTCTLPCNPLSGTTCTINPQLTCTTLFTDDGSPNCTFYGATTYAVNTGALCNVAVNGSWQHCKNGLVCLPDSSGTNSHCRAYCVLGTSCASGACAANPWLLDKTYGHCP
jgi:hypothetical protein